MGKTNTLKAKSHMIGILVTSHQNRRSEASYSHVKRHNLMNIHYMIKGRCLPYQGRISLVVFFILFGNPDMKTWLFLYLTMQ
jgi:hypothetical protein